MSGVLIDGQCEKDINMTVLLDYLKAAGVTVDAVTVYP